MADRLADFTAAATRAPYELDLGDGTVISLPHPTNAQWREACKGDDLSHFLTVLGADETAAARVAEAFAAADYGSEEKFVVRVGEFFGKGN